MSRLIVKNLPKGIKEERLKTLFEKFGNITDCCLKFSKDGVFRKFAFVGYKTAQEADAAIKHFNNTFIDTSKIQVEIAKDFGDKNKPRAWSKYSKESSAFKKKAETEKSSEEILTKKKLEQTDSPQQKVVDEILGDLRGDREFEEFMDAHTSKSKTPVWMDNTASGLNKQTIKTHDKSDEDSDSNDDVDIENNESDIQSTNLGNITSKVSVESNKARKKAVSDLEYLKSKMTDDLLLSESDSDSDTTDVKDIKLDVKEEVECKDSTLRETKPLDTDEKAGSRFELKMKGFQGNFGEDVIKEFFQPLQCVNIRIPRNARKKSIGVAYVGFQSEAAQDQAMRKNKNFIGGKRIFLKKILSEPKETKTKEDMRPWELKQQDPGEVEDIGESGRLFVRNLSYSCTEEELEEYFGKFGPLTEVTLPIDMVTKKVKGFALITYMIPENAVKAFTQLDGVVFQGRMLHILPAKTKNEDDMEINEGSSYKTKKKAEQKSLAGSSHNWNTLFLGANAVADVMAEKYGTTKSQLLDAETSESLGVRMALGETQIIAETREFLQANGVSLDCFSQANAPRSKTVVLVKNLPARTSPQDLRDVFSLHGDVGRIVLPPSGITAVVEYFQPTEAKRAFMKLAYTRFNHVPLYLEWAPIEIFTKPLQELEKSEDQSMDASSKVESKDGSSSEDEAEPGSTLFVKNLNFDTDEKSLAQHFSKCGKIQVATVAKKKNVKKTGEMLSMGYGFVEFKKKIGAEKAIREMQHSTLDGHQLELKISNRSTIQPKVMEKKKQKKKKQTTTKILVRNIPFEATKKEVFDLFKVFGELKFVRLPKKMGGTGTHRGFAFVDFLTKHDAKRAFDSLCHSTHLYGRRLVLEWADTAEDLEDLRRKTAERYYEDGPKKKVKQSAVKEYLETS